MVVVEWVGDAVNKQPAVLRIENLTVRYAPAGPAILQNVNLDFGRGEFVLICGPTGSGKTTLIRALLGLIPVEKGTQIAIFDEQKNALVSTVGLPTNQLARLIGYVNQNVETAFAAETVEQEIAFGMEQLGFDPAQMRARVHDLAQILELDGLLDREPQQLSSGQQQRVAIAAALAAGQRILLLDEPTSALDDHSALATYDLLRRLSSDLGITVVMIEHRIERAVGLVDSIILVDGTGAVRAGSNEVLSNFAVPLGTQPKPAKFDAPIALKVEKISVRHGQLEAVAGASFELKRGEIVGLRGPNGSGKSSLLWAIQGVGPKSSGAASTADNSFITMVPQRASDLLFLDSVAAECSESDQVAGCASGTTQRLLRELVGEIDSQAHPRDLSAGQQLSLALSVQLANRSTVILLDEPTSSLDYRAKRVLASQLSRLRDEGKTLLVASHDADFLAGIASRILLIENGRLEAEPADLRGDSK